MYVLMFMHVLIVVFVLVSRFTLIICSKTSPHGWYRICTHNTQWFSPNFYSCNRLFLCGWPFVNVCSLHTNTHTRWESFYTHTLTTKTRTLSGRDGWLLHSGSFYITGSDRGSFNESFVCVCSQGFPGSKWIIDTVAQYCEYSINGCCRGPWESCGAASRWVAN